MPQILLVCLLLTSLCQGSEAPVRPNIILIVADDLGYGDLACFGGKTTKTPHLDRLAAQGMKLTDFHVSQAVCSASRASLLTGALANRISMQGALNHTSREGLNAMEVTMAEWLKPLGYRSAIYGKWHLGTRPCFWPLKCGFDEFWGIPYSNDNSRHHPSLAAEMPPLPLIEDDRVMHTDPDQSQFTAHITAKAVSFIRRHQTQPFFLYLPHIMPHVPIFASERFKGRNPAGRYADVIEELDWSVGMVIAALEQTQQLQRSIVFFLSDNGPFLSYGNHAGSAGSLREGKLTSYEGGVRVPFIAQWPGRIPAGSQSAAMTSSMDLLPTLAQWLGTPLPQAILDGKSIAAILEGQPGAKSPHESLPVYAGGELQAVRSGRFKLHLPHSYLTVGGPPGRDGKPARHDQLKPSSITQSGIEGIATRHGYQVAQQDLALYDLDEDPGEQRDISAQFPTEVARLKALAQTWREKLGDSLTKTQGHEVRPAGFDKP